MPENIEMLKFRQKPSYTMHTHWYVSAMSNVINMEERP